MKNLAIFCQIIFKYKAITIITYVYLDIPSLTRVELLVEGSRRTNNIQRTLSFTLMSRIVLKMCF